MRTCKIVQCWEVVAHLMNVVTYLKNYDVCYINFKPQDFMWFAHTMYFNKFYPWNERYMTYLSSWVH